MLMPVIVGIVIVVALLRGGSLRNFGALRVRWLPLVFAALAVQLLIFTPFARVPPIAAAVVPLYLLSMALLTLWVAANWRIPGMALMAAGLLMNLAAIVANGGHMPVSSASARYAGAITSYVDRGETVSNNSIVLDGQARLWLLTDIIALTKAIPFANVFSIGDVLLTIGAGLLCYRTIRAAPEVTAPTAANTASSASARHVHDDMPSMQPALDPGAADESLAPQVDALEGPRADGTRQPARSPE